MLLVVLPKNCHILPKKEKKSVFSSPQKLSYRFCEIVKCFSWNFWHLNQSNHFRTKYPFWQWLEILKVKNNTPFALFQQLFVSVFGQMWQKRYFNLNHKSSCLRTSFLKFFKLSWVHAIALLEDFVDEEQNCIGRN